jgi:hypothetical protein
MDTNWDIKRDTIYISLASIGQMGYIRARSDTKMVSDRVTSRSGRHSEQQQDTRDAFPKVEWLNDQ